MDILVNTIYATTLFSWGYVVIMVASAAIKRHKGE